MTCKHELFNHPISGEIYEHVHESYRGDGESVFRDAA